MQLNVNMNIKQLYQENTTEQLLCTVLCTIQNCMMMYTNMVATEFGSKKSSNQESTKS